MSCWLQRWKSLLKLDYLSYLSECRKLTSPFPKGVGSSDACTSTPWFREPRKLRGDSAEGEPKPVSLSCPTQVSQAHTIFPGPVPVILGPAASLWDHFSFSLSLPARLILITVGPPRASAELGECDVWHLHRSQRQGNGVLEHQSWDHEVDEELSETNTIFLKILLNLCSKFQE